MMKWRSGVLILRLLIEATRMAGANGLLRCSFAGAARCWGDALEIIEASAFYGA
jgi:hypothetical protein